VTATDGTNVTAPDQTAPDQTASDQTATDQTGRPGGQQTWAGAARDVGRSVRRHKIVSVLIALGIAGSLTAIGLIGSSSGGGPAKPVAAATFSLPALGHAGQQVALSGYRDRPLIVNFFASWCEPCQRETPLLAKFYRSEKGKVALVGLDENDVVGNATTFTRKQGVSYPVGWDPAGTAATSYGVNALPQTFFLNAKHQVVDRVFGAVTLADLRKGIALATAAG
jgi:cytochrome c biogenesis protein CcmG, thiol:disulfide interchange protein DsbE